MGTTEFAHGRKAQIMQLPGTSDFIAVVFSSGDSLPEYDIQGFPGDVSIGEFLRENATALGAEEIDARHIPVVRTKISRDYGHVADAISWMERQSRVKSPDRERGALYLLEDTRNGTWAIWLESWSDYFNRSHIFISPERHERETEERKAREAAELIAIKAASTTAAEQEMAKPTTWIFLAIVGAILLFQLFRLF